MRLTKRITAVGLVVTGAVLLAATAVGAATIRGTAGNDTIRGGAKADKLYGLGGNDRLYGAGGNDVLAGGAGNDFLVGAAGSDHLVGGPGADRLSCGAGRDTVSGDAKDKVARDCEVVRGVPAPVQPPPPTPPTPPTPPPAPAPKALPGIYCGNTVQGPPLCITTNADATALVKIETSSLVDCTEPVQFRFEFTIGFEGTLAIQPDLTFDLTYDGPLASGSSEITNLQTSYFIRGTFTTDGKASGQLAVSTLSFDYMGYHISCTQNPVDWSATKQG